MFSIIRLFLVAAALIALSACGGTDYPNIPAQTTQYADGSHGLVGWAPAPTKTNGVKHRIIPEDAVFEGAVSWVSSTPERNPKKAALRSAKAQGLRGAKVIAIAKTKQKYLRVIEPSKKGQAHIVMLKGQIKGQSSRAVMLVWYGKFGLPEGAKAETGVTAFMAPEKAFVALGGFAIPAVRSGMAATNPDEDMSKEGRLPPKKATKRFAQFFDVWASNYPEQVIANGMMNMMMMQTMQIQQQTLNQMQSYNNATSMCAGMDNCSVEMNGDGTWSADIQ